MELIVITPSCSSRARACVRTYARALIRGEGIRGAENESQVSATGDKRNVQARGGGVPGRRGGLRRRVPGDGVRTYVGRWADR